MRINKQNYEAWFIDYIEGKLNKEDTSMLLKFLEANPDLQQELSSFESITVNEESEKNLDFSFLKKTNKEADELLCIDYIENNVSADQRHSIESRLKDDPEFKATLSLISSTILVTDQSIKFPNKKSLKKSTPVKAIWYYSAALAACIALAFILFRAPEQNVSPEKPMAIAKPKLSLPKAPEKQPEIAFTESKPQTNQIIPVIEEQTERPAVENADPLPVKQIENPIYNNEHAIAYLEVKEPQLIVQSENSDYLSIKDLVKGFLRKKATDVAKETGISKKPETLTDIAGIGINQISRITGLNLGYRRDELASTNETSFKLGKFEIARTHQKK